jgi:hypothetical protein
VFAGVVPFGVDVEGVLVVLAHAGNSSSAPLIMKSPNSPQAFLERLPPAAIPKHTIPSIGIGNHSP